MPRLGPGEVRYYDRFRNQVASAMGHQVEGPSDFWLRCVLRESSVDDCILDVVVAIGALAYARDCAPSGRPLFLTSSLDQHYREAITHYARALEKLRRRIADPSAVHLQRTILINTVLLSFFESIQGNTESSDKLIAHGLSLLKDSMLQDSGHGDHTSRIAALTDDDGVLEAESFLVRTATWNIQYSPLYPHQGVSVLGISCQQPHLIPFPVSTHNTQEFWKAWWHIVTMTAVWNARVQDELLQQTLSSKSSTEHDILLTRLKAWEAAALDRMGSETIPSNIAVFTQVYIGARVLSLFMHCGIDPTGTAWEENKDRCLEILSYYRIAIAKDGPAYARTIIYDAILAGVSQLAVASRDYEVRFGALRLWKTLVHPQSSWDIKSIFMGTSALIATEEEHRNAQGSIPLESRYKWTRGTWNHSCTEFHVTLTSSGREPRRRLNLTLRPADFGLD
ncbi:hypothetical protein F5X68DRAFT_39576 [Plectosphaerella plurivora]|uniref:Uncharacterized protein n=1 Tax=Plectosphaerella plurivora TaxID=936078 RepID=A0A9P9A589_9PEZI|nr:hypothetical protein F5X68DRAFT_39576 [Plectosphaerella plurivora]